MPHSPARTSRAGHALLRSLTGLVATSVLLAGCTSAPEEPDQTTGVAPSAAPGAAHLDLSGLPIPRADVCALLPEDGLEQALDAPVAQTGHYGNGEEVEIAPGRVDISHEYGCVFEAGDGTTASTWIFARPVMRPEARTLVRRARHGRDCAFPESIRFGTPSLTSVCEVASRAADGPLVRARLEGLFGGTWMGCEVEEPLERPSGSSPTPRVDVVQRAEQWCTEVVTAIAAS